MSIYIYKKLLTFTFHFFWSTGNEGMNPINLLASDEEKIATILSIQPTYIYILFYD